MLTITTASELIDPLTRMRRSLAWYSAPVSSVHAPSWADFTITTRGLNFSVYTTYPRNLKRRFAKVLGGGTDSGRYAPPVHMIKLTRKITPSVWMHPD